ncbi:fasciclin domain-containing protein [Lewinella sp. IMCC34191]|uniref:fasciclin domain-containing protein n=1 Tax=Lewinella sp. IMCC34191 TaxID=2259172 RepID=UPI0018E4E58D|nr:fasciclin domain-containing protein [Lewinella sp. IMCC34191]
MLRSYRLFTFLLFALVLGFSSCGEDDEFPTVPVIGTIADNLQDDPEFSSFVAALERTGQINFLDGPTARLTVFAPNNAAFAAAGIDLGSISDEELGNIISYHYLNGEILRDGDIADGRSLYDARNSQGPGGANVPITFDNSGGSIMLQGMANITAGPVEAVNGVYYTIDNVLMPPTLVDRATLDGNFTILLEALARVGLDDVLSEDGDYTVFAPTDDAFNASGINLSTVSDENLTDLLLYHVLGTGIPAADIPAGQSFQTTLSTDGPDDSMLSLMITNDDSVTVNGQAMVVAPDFYGTNGVIHGIDDVLEMQSISDFLMKANQLDSLEAALMAAGLDDDLMMDGPFTVFAPVNAAFTAAADTLATLDMSGIQEVLLYHVLSGNIQSDSLSDNQVITTLSSGQTFSINMEEDMAPTIVTYDSTMVNFITTDVQGTNGVVHLIDGILLPNLED